MRVFVSWSGALSREFASVLRQYLPSMIQQLDVFMSKHDIDSGARWSAAIASELEQSSFGIICLTPDNQTAPWILFEAGALTKHLEGRACCLLLNNLKPSDMSGPLTQFQNRPFEKEEVKKLLFDINSKLPNPLGEGQLGIIFEKWWPDIETASQGVQEQFSKQEPVRPSRDQREILEEILLRVRSVEELSVIKKNQFKVERDLIKSVERLEEVFSSLKGAEIRLSGSGSSPFKSGDKVNHPKFGPGTVVASTDSEATVMFPGQGLKKLAIKFANLEVNQQEEISGDQDDLPPEEDLPF